MDQKLLVTPFDKAEPGHRKPPSSFAPAASGNVLKACLALVKELSKADLEHLKREI